MSYEEEDTCMSYEEEDTCMSYELVLPAGCRDQAQGICQWARREELLAAGPHSRTWGREPGAQA